MYGGAIVLRLRPMRWWSLIAHQGPPTGGKEKNKLQMPSQAYLNTPTLLRSVLESNLRRQSWKPGPMHSLLPMSWDINLNLFLSFYSYLIVSLEKKHWPCLRSSWLTWWKKINFEGMIFSAGFIQSGSKVFGNDRLRLEGGDESVPMDQRRRNEAEFASITASSFPSWMQAWSDSQTSLWASGFALCHCLNGDFVLKIRQDLWHSAPYLSDDAQQSRFV